MMRTSRQNQLDANQERLLSTWGYPYVLDEFRFHMTLTGPISDVAVAQSVAHYLDRWFAPVCDDALTVDALCLFVQADAASPFRIMERFSLG